MSRAGCERGPGGRRHPPRALGAAGPGVAGHGSVARDTAPACRAGLQPTSEEDIREPYTTVTSTSTTGPARWQWAPKLDVRPTRRLGTSAGPSTRAFTAHSDM